MQRISFDDDVTVFRCFSMEELLPRGVGCHHAGLCHEDRCSVEALFRSGGLPVLVSTSTLAMGVNLPAHLVVVKSTTTYSMGPDKVYPDLVLDQMLGRAGRPQFDVSGTAVIMTKASLKDRFDKLVHGTQPLESSLHLSLVEHLNAEIVLGTVQSLSGCVDWAKSTFFYVRLQSNPTHYGLPPGLDKHAIDSKLRELCMEGVAALSGIRLVTLDAGTGRLQPTAAGSLMARYCISVDTMERFSKLSDERISPADLIQNLSSCVEYADVQLRTTEKATLNALNGSKKTPGIRYPIKGRIKTRDLKVNCLLQATLGCLNVTDPSLAQDVPRVLRVGQRLAKVLLEFLLLQPNCGFSTLLHVATLHKCLQAKLWQDSPHVTRQIDKIGVTLSSTLTRAGLNSLDKVAAVNPRELELLVNRNPPFGTQVVESARRFPKYQLDVRQEGTPSRDRTTLTVELHVTGRGDADSAAQTGKQRPLLQGAPVHLLVGDADDRLLMHQRISPHLQLSGWTRRIGIQRAAAGDALVLCVVSSKYVGVDVRMTITPNYADDAPTAAARITLQTPSVSARGRITATPKTEGSRRPSRLPLPRTPNLTARAPANGGIQDGTSRASSSAFSMEAIAERRHVSGDTPAARLASAKRIRETKKNEAQAATFSVGNREEFQEEPERSDHQLEPMPSNSCSKGKDQTLGARSGPSTSTYPQDSPEWVSSGGHSQEEQFWDDNWDVPEEEDSNPAKKSRVMGAEISASENTDDGEAENLQLPIVTTDATMLQVDDQDAGNYDWVKRSGRGSDGFRHVSSVDNRQLPTPARIAIVGPTVGDAGRGGNEAGGSGGDRGPWRAGALEDDFAAVAKMLLSYLSPTLADRLARARP